jgi:Fe-S-cluster-containing dehydrogenase component
MESSRRRFIKIAGIAALGLGAQPLIKVTAPASQDGPQPVMGSGAEALSAQQWAMVIDTRRFKSDADVKPLVDACHKVHNVPQIANRLHEIKWIWATHFHNAFPSIGSAYLSEKVEHRPYLVLCNQCENPPCVRACPTKATFKRDDGIIMMDFHRCIGCRFCMAACPYGARSFNFRDPRDFIVVTDKTFPTRMKGVVEKCNFCSERLAKGELPACVQASNGAIVFGDLKDPESKVRQVLRENFTIRRKEDLGTEPCVYYIV